MRTRGFQAVLLLSILCGMLPAASGDLKSTGVDRYDTVVAAAVEFLQTTSHIPDEHSSLVAYALFKAGVDLSDPRLADGIGQAQQRARAASYDLYAGLYLAAVDAMLLADVDRVAYKDELQSIADVIVSNQRNEGAWSNPQFIPDGPCDVSLTQYCILGLWAARRGGCRVSPEVFDRAAQYLTTNIDPSGGWKYLIDGPSGGGTRGPHRNMTMAAIGTLAICRLLLYPEIVVAETNEGPVPGVLKRTKQDKAPPVGYPGYSAITDRDQIDECIRRGIEWDVIRFRVIPPPSSHVLYFYYTVERAGALVGLQEDWYTIYGDGLMTLQQDDGHFVGYAGTYGADVGTSFAILYFMRSTQQILDYGKGVQTGARDLVDFLNPRRKSNKPVGPLDELLLAMEGQNFADLDVSTEDVVEKIQYSSREDLIGEADKLKVLIRNPDPANRQLAYWALSRTGDFDLIPLMLDGLNDPALNVNVEALSGLRYISRQPKGLGMSLDPLAQAPPGASETARLNAANVWREKASRVWRSWYSKVRPYSDRDGLDEIGLPTE